jgi:H+/Cl- antiporter ClcA
VLVAIWLIGWVVLFAEKILQTKQSKFSKWFNSLIEQSQKRYWVLVIVPILTGCASSTSVQIKPVCPPMLREATYKAMQADEIADYRIAVEKCRVF